MLQEQKYLKGDIKSNLKNNFESKCSYQVIHINAIFDEVFVKF